MPHDPVLVEDTRKWLSKALEDLEMAVYCGPASPMERGAAFHAQQAA